MKYLKKFNENFSAINENVELPQSVKDTLQDVFSKMSPQDIEALRKQLAGVTEEEIKDAAEEEVQAQVQGGQGQAQSAPTNENFLKKAGEDAKIAWENNMIKRGLAKRDENGVLVSLKTGKPLVYAR